jgi:hypothetical protein
MAASQPYRLAIQRPLIANIARVVFCFRWRRDGGDGSAGGGRVRYSMQQVQGISEVSRVPPRLDAQQA